MSTQLCVRALMGVALASLGIPVVAAAALPASIPVIVVTATAEHSPLHVETDPKLPRQPLPAHDGADFLKTIAGFAVTRKAGTDGDPIFRGMPGSRLNILVDGASVLGGCNGRMDAPTAYIFPETYDRLTIIKGPQSVRHGPGTSAATVLFERHVERFDEPGYRAQGSVVLGSAGRHDEVADLRLGRPVGYLQFNATNSQADDYAAGDGHAVHSAYRRYSAGAAIGWTPDEHTRLELALTHSDGRAAYADRAMDGTKFLRHGFDLSFGRSNLPGRLTGIEARVYASSVDHVMDDQQLRQPGMMGYANPRRFTSGARASTTLRTFERGSVEIGIDAQTNRHDARSASATGSYTPYSDDARFAQQGAFAEWTQPLRAGHGLIGGYRIDRWHAKDERLILKGMMGPRPNPTAGHARNEWRHSGFARIESQPAELPVTLYAGLGHAERFPDYWEAIARESMTGASAFDSLRSERTTQVDAGLVYHKARATLSLALFANRVNDYILIDYANPMKRNGVARNVDAASHGGELGLEYPLDRHWSLEAALAYVRGENRSDDLPLPQIPPLDARLGLNYARDAWSAGFLIRGVAAQSRYDLDRGSIVGKDLGPAPGFAVLSLNGGWRISETLQLAAGIDNLLDRNYAEFVSRAGGNGMGGAIAGYVQTTRVHEPGRTLWLRIAARLP